MQQSASDHDADTVIACLGDSVSRHYRVIIFRHSGEGDYYVYHVGTCPTIATGPNFLSSLDHEAFSAFEMLEPMISLPRTLSAKLSPLCYLGVSLDEFRTADERIVCPPLECVVARDFGVSRST